MSELLYIGDNCIVNLDHLESARLMQVGDLAGDLVHQEMVFVDGRYVHTETPEMDADGLLKRPLLLLYVADECYKVFEKAEIIFAWLKRQACGF